MGYLEVDGVSYPLMQEKLLLPSFDLVSWVSEQAVYPKVFWKDRESLVARVALGSLVEWDYLPSFASTEDVRLYGGIRFDSQKEKEAVWDGFENERFWLPQYEVVQGELGTELIVYSFSRESLQKDIAGLSLKMGGRTFTSPSISAQEEDPPFQQWELNVGRVLKEIACREIEKVILVRKTVLHYLFPPSPWDILKQLRARGMRASVFAFQLDEKSCFLGATPEKLLEKKGDLLITEALAGTRPRGVTHAEDKQMEQDLLCHPKDRKEFGIVKEFLEKTLAAYSDEIRWEGDDGVLKTTHVQHLYNRLLVRLRLKITTRELLYLLHPTPALGGNPRKAALSLIRELEPFDRGWYGAPVGMVSQDNASFAVAIRSALVRENTLHLFAGAGIVEESEALQEWEELNHKIAPFLQLSEAPA